MISNMDRLTLWRETNAVMQLEWVEKSWVRAWAMWLGSGYAAVSVLGTSIGVGCAAGRR